MLDKVIEQYKSDKTGILYTIDRTDKEAVFRVGNSLFTKKTLREHIRELLVMAKLMDVDIFETEKKEDEAHEDSELGE